MQKKLFLIVFFLFLFVLAFHYNIKKSSSVNLADEKGQVLGVSENGKSAENNKEGDFKIALIEKKENSLVLPEKIQPTKNLNFSEFKIKSEAGGAYDEGSFIKLFGKNEDKKRPIASLTKLMTAFVFLNFNPGWDKIYQIKNNDLISGGKNNLYLGEKITIENLFNLSLVASDNSATLALINSTGKEEKEFIDEMNKQAKELGLNNTFFYDPIGLNDKNFSTAAEIARLANYIFKNEEISRATLMGSYEFKTLKRRHVRVNNTDKLLSIFPQNGIRILGGKTGFTNSAGYCFVAKFIDADNHPIITVILGAPEESLRFQESSQLANWVYKNYDW